MLHPMSNENNLTQIQIAEASDCAIYTKVTNFDLRGRVECPYCSCSEAFHLNQCPDCRLTVPPEARILDNWNGFPKDSAMPRGRPPKSGVTVHDSSTEHVLVPYSDTDSSDNTSTPEPADTPSTLLGTPPEAKVPRLSFSASPTAKQPFQVRLNRLRVGDSSFLLPPSDQPYLRLFPGYVQFNFPNKSGIQLPSRCVVFPLPDINHIFYCASSTLSVIFIMMNPGKEEKVTQACGLPHSKGLDSHRATSRYITFIGDNSLVTTREEFEVVGRYFNKNQYICKNVESKARGSVAVKRQHQAYSLTSLNVNSAMDIIKTQDEAFYDMYVCARMRCSTAGSKARVFSVSKRFSDPSDNSASPGAKLVLTSSKTPSATGSSTATAKMVYLPASDSSTGTTIRPQVVRVTQGGVVRATSSAISSELLERVQRTNSIVEAAVTSQRTVSAPPVSLPSQRPTVHPKSITTVASSAFKQAASSADITLQQLMRASSPSVITTQTIKTTVPGSPSQLIRVPRVPPPGSAPAVFTSQLGRAATGGTHVRPSVPTMPASHLVKTPTTLNSQIIRARAPGVSTTQIIRTPGTQLVRASSQLTRMPVPAYQVQQVPVLQAQSSNSAVEQKSTSTESDDLIIVSMSGVTDTRVDNPIQTISQMNTPAATRVTTALSLPKSADMVVASTLKREAAGAAIVVQNNRVIVHTPTATARQQGSQEEETNSLPPRLLPTVEHIKKFTYSPANGNGVTIHNEDLMVLNPGEFLNDVVVDFYMKYLFYEILTPEQRDRTFIFNSFFYKRLTYTKLPPKDPSGLPLSKRRHNLVAKWTKRVNVFEKDFIVMPINENSHWFLAIICFAWMAGVVNYTELFSASGGDGHNVLSIAKQLPSTSHDLLKHIEGKDGAIHMPCILMFDSLIGASRSPNVKMLREWMQEEWNIKMRSVRGEKSFDKETVRGFSPKVPQQPNFYDCGPFVVHYAEMFFLKPVHQFTKQYFQTNMTQWFPETDAQDAKRAKIQDLIIDIYKKQVAEGVGVSEEKEDDGDAPVVPVRVVPSTQAAQRIRQQMQQQVQQHIQQSTKICSDSPGILGASNPPVAVLLTNSTAGTAVPPVSAILVSAVSPTSSTSTASNTNTNTAQIYNTNNT